jgi:hypothetical protein
MSPKEVMQKLGHELIYADTDSVFIKKSNGIYRSVWKTRIPYFLFSKSKLDKCLDLGNPKTVRLHKQIYANQYLDSI